MCVIGLSMLWAGLAFLSCRDFWLRLNSIFGTSLPVLLPRTRALILLYDMTEIERTTHSEQMLSFTVFISSLVLSLLSGWRSDLDPGTSTC